MALSGAFEGSIKSGHYKVRVEWSATQNVANNTSTITAKMYMINDWNMEISARDNAHSITIDGTKTTYSSSAIKGTGSRLIGTATKTVTHNADGTKSVAMSAVFAIKAYFDSEYVANITASSTITLDPIARASQPTLSASSVNFGSDITVYTNRASTSFTHILNYSVNGGTEVCISTSVADSYKWTVPASLMSEIPNATSATITLKLITASGNTVVGTKTVSFTATVPSSVVPSISKIDCSDPYGYAATYGGYVQSKSAVKVAVTAEGSYSSTIKSYKITANDANYSYNNCTTDVLQRSGSTTITATVTDSRGRTATSTTTISVLEYNKPRISKLSVVRCLADGTENEDGAYMKVTTSASIKELNNKNTKKFELFYKVHSDSEYPIEPHTTWNTAYSISTSVVIAADIDYSYDVQLVATDAFGSSAMKVSVGTSFTLIDFRDTGKGIAFGKASEQDAFECNIPAIFKSCKTQSGKDLDNMVIPEVKSIKHILSDLTWKHNALGFNYAQIDVSAYGIKKILAVSKGEWYAANPGNFEFTVPSDTTIIINSYTDSITTGAYLYSRITYI